MNSAYDHIAVSSKFTAWDLSVGFAMFFQTCEGPLPVLAPDIQRVCPTVKTSQ